MNGQQTQQEIARALLVKGKGILAADESNHSMNARLRARALSETSEMRRRYRELLFTTPGIERYISGVILYEETLSQNTSGGDPFVMYIKEKGILSGIKVDQGLIDNPDTPGEQITQGLEGLADRLKSFREKGAQFAKWRGVFSIGDGLPTDQDITEDTNALAQYAKECQLSGVVPIVEPEVLYAGDHSIEESEHATHRVLSGLFKALSAYDVSLDALILKTGMVLAGKETAIQSSPQEVAQHTLSVLNECVPKEIGGVVFLSGGQTPLQATSNLNEIALQATLSFPITFSYSRAVQDPVLDAWKGDDSNKEHAQKIFIHRLRMNALARDGQYAPELEI